MRDEVAESVWTTARSLRGPGRWTDSFAASLDPLRLPPRPLWGAWRADASVDASEITRTASEAEMARSVLLP